MRIPGSADLIVERSRVIVADRFFCSASASGGGSSSVRERCLPPVDAPGLLRTCAIRPSTPRVAARGEQFSGCRPVRSLAAPPAPAVRPRALPWEESCEASECTDRKAFVEENERRIARAKSVWLVCEILFLRAATMPAQSPRRR